MSTEQQPAHIDTSLSQDTGQAPNMGEVCIPNISPTERRKRLTVGVVTFALSLVILIALMALGFSRWWRVPLFFLFIGAATGFFQWRDQTCISLASRSSRKLGDTAERIEDASELAQVNRQARRVQRKSLMAALALTVIAVILPPLG